MYRVCKVTKVCLTFVEQSKNTCTREFGSGVEQTCSTSRFQFRHFGPELVPERSPKRCPKVNVKRAAFFIYLRGPPGGPPDPQRLPKDRLKKPPRSPARKTTPQRPPPDPIGPTNPPQGPPEDPKATKKHDEKTSKFALLTGRG